MHAHYGYLGDTVSPMSKGKGVSPQGKETGMSAVAITRQRGPWLRQIIVLRFIRITFQYCVNFFFVGQLNKV